MKWFTRMVAAGAGVLMLSASAFAHDFWIQVAAYRVQPGTVVKVGLHVGDIYPGDTFPRSAAKIEKFIAVGPEGEQPIVGREGQDPAGFVRFTRPGEYVLAYRSTPSYVDLPAEKFEHYLKDKGLEKVIDARAASGQSQSNGREMFSRCAKAIVSVGEATPGFDREIGLRLEVIPLVDPLTLKPGDDLPVKLLYEGKPCPGITLFGTNVPLGSKTMLPEKASAKTDDQGRATLKLAGPGLWVLNAVEMVPAPAGEPNADWESLWASLSFDIPAETAAK